MVEALTYEAMVNNIKQDMERGGVLYEMIGILITRPELETGKSILNSLEYFHFRTGKKVKFYLPGYGAYWTNNYPDGKVVAEIDNVEWSFSNKMFVQFVKELEKSLKWEYLGESELLLLESHDGNLLHENMIQLHLDNMLRDGIINSVYNFFEMLFRICQVGCSLDEISNKLGIGGAKLLTQEMILENLPLNLGKAYMKERYFCVKKTSAKVKR